MVNTHEIQLGETEFNAFKGVGYIIMQVGDIETDDYILFKQVSGDPATETGQYQMTKVRGITNHEGFKDGYALLTLSYL